MRAFLVLLVIFVSCRDSIVLVEGQPPSKTSTLLLIYMAADNELAPFAVQDLDEMEAGLLPGSPLEVIVLWDHPGVQKGGETLWRVVPDLGGLNGRLVSQPLLREELSLGQGPLGEADTSNRQVLRDFVDWGKRRSPQSSLALVVWGHGGGWKSQGPVGGGPSRAVAFDDESGGRGLSIADLAWALEDRDVSFLGLDVCYGALLETAVELASCVPLLAATEGSEPQEGWDYRRWFTAFQQTGDASRLGETAVEAYGETWVGTGKGGLSLLDLRRAEASAEAIDQLSDALESWMTDGFRQQFLRDRLFFDLRGPWEAPGPIFIDPGTAVLGLTGRGLPLDETLANELLTTWKGFVRDRWSPQPEGNEAGFCLSLGALDAQGRFTGVEDDYWGDGTQTRLKFLLDHKWSPNRTLRSGFLYQLWYKTFS